MENSFEALQFYVKALTGLLLLLNFALLISIRFGLNWAKQLNGHLPEAERAPAWQKSSRILGVLIVMVIGMNGAAIYVNVQLRHSANALAGEAGGSSIELSQAPD